MSEVQRVIAALRGYRLPLGDEKDTQRGIAAIFKNEKIQFEREVKLDDGDIIDFIAFGSIGVEVKLKASRTELLAQCERQAKDPRISTHIVAANVATGWPETISGKPAYFVNLAVAWMLG